MLELVVFENSETHGEVLSRDGAERVVFGRLEILEDGVLND